MSKAQLHQPKIGDLAADFTLPEVDGDQVTLSTCIKPVSLVFLRHLA
jgi:hypothetical protein